MFSDSDIAKRMTMSRTKASYSVTDGLSALVRDDLCKEVQVADAGFTLLFDETTTNQDKKQMDLLIRFFSEDSTTVTTKYITSFFFGHATGDDLCKLFASFIADKDFDIPWERLISLSSDGPAINKKLYGLLRNKLKALKLGPLLPFIPCSLHIVHKAFFKGVSSLPLDVDQLAFDLHAWFKRQPCKKEDFLLLAKGCDLSTCCESLFLRHVNSRWLTLSPALQRIFERWDDAKNYFLVFLANDKKKKKDLAKNKRYQRIVEALKGHNKVLLNYHLFVY